MCLYNKDQSVQLISKSQWYQAGNYSIFKTDVFNMMGLSGGLGGKETVCNAGGLGLIPG